MKLVLTGHPNTNVRQLRTCDLCILSFVRLTPSYGLYNHLEATQQLTIYTVVNIVYCRGAGILKYI